MHFSFLAKKFSSLKWNHVLFRQFLQSAAIDNTTGLFIRRCHLAEQWLVTRLIESKDSWSSQKTPGSSDWVKWLLTRMIESKDSWLGSDPDIKTLTSHCSVHYVDSRINGCTQLKDHTCSSQRCASCRPRHAAARCMLTCWDHKLETWPACSSSLGYHRSSNITQYL